MFYSKINVKISMFIASICEQLYAHKERECALAYVSICNVCCVVFGTDASAEHYIDMLYYTMFLLEHFHYYCCLAYSSSSSSLLVLLLLFVLADAAR